MAFKTIAGQCWGLAGGEGLWIGIPARGPHVLGRVWAVQRIRLGLSMPGPAPRRPGLARHSVLHKLPRRTRRHSCPHRLLPRLRSIAIVAYMEIFTTNSANVLQRTSWRGFCGTTYRRCCTGSPLFNTQQRRFLQRIPSSTKTPDLAFVFE